MIELILGGARSGKSALAEQKAAASGMTVIYIATGQSGDREMAERIHHHRARRPAAWQTVEEPVHLATTLVQHCATNTCILVDCLTLWLSNLLFTGTAAQQAEQGTKPDCPLLTAEIHQLLTTIPSLPGKIILVSNEVGMGIIPLGALNRLFADEQGRLNQKIAVLANHVTLVSAGIPLPLK